MATLIKDFQVVLAGDVYPTTFRAGEKCPDEVLEIAKSLGLIETPKRAPSNKMAKQKLEKK